MGGGRVVSSGLLVLGDSREAVIWRAVRRKPECLFPKVAFPDAQEGVGLVEAV
jgi:hypothetical protein